MANRERGEMRLQAGDQTYVLFLTTNACCDVEDKSGKTFNELWEGLTKGSVSALRWLLWAALQDRHSDTVVVPSDVGHIIDAAGGMANALDQMVAFLKLNTPPEGNGTGAAPTGPETPARPPDLELAPRGGSSILTLERSA
jgi:hypothetical protein